jgi:hypothetical protein
MQGVNRMREEKVVQAAESAVEGSSGGGGRKCRGRVQAPPHNKLPRLETRKDIKRKRVDARQRGGQARKEAARGEKQVRSRAVNAEYTNGRRTRQPKSNTGLKARQWLWLNFCGCWERARGGG